MPDKPLDAPSLLKRSAPVALVAVAALLALIIVNPFREMLSQDDAWAYARMVQHLLATGKYQLDAFTAANMTVQIYLAAGLARVFGYSLVLLRLTTLALLVVALTSFYLLLRDFRQSRGMSALFTLALLASPLVLILSFAFMSDVQFLAWLLLALLLYVRGLRDQSIGKMFLGSLAAGCAIGTRQFGMALVIGLVLSWLLSRPAVRPRLTLLFAGLLVPSLAAIAQVYFGLRAPNFIQSVRLAQTHAFLTSPAPVLLKEFFWRCCIITQYLGMALLPLLPLTFAATRFFWRKRLGRIPLWILALLGCGAIVVALYMSSPLTARTDPHHHRGLWAPLELLWLLPVNLEQAHPVMRVLDFAGIIGAAPLLLFALNRLPLLCSPRALQPEKLFLAGAGIGLLVLHLLYNQLNDTYIADLIPFILLLTADTLRRVPEHKALQRLSAVASVSIILAFAFWLRAEFAMEQAQWESADALHRTGIPPVNIDAPLHWELYNGAFDDWVALGHPEPFYGWFDQRSSQAAYHIWLQPSPAAPAGWRLLAVRSYRNVAFHQRYVVTLERDRADK